LWRCEGDIMIRAEYGKLLDSALAGCYLVNWGPDDLDATYLQLMTEAALVVLTKALYVD